MRLVAQKKYAYYLRKYATVKKIQNILLNKRELKNGEITLRSFPFKFTFDPSSLCNLRCTGCHTGIKHPEMIKPSVLKFDDFRTMFDKIKDYALSISLYNWGEPFLNKDIFKIIQYTGENKVGTTLHSNFNHFTEEMAEKLVRSGLTHLYLSIDGANQEVYSIYRVKGDYETVVKNIEILVKKKKELNSKFPIITWKFLTFDHNIHQVKLAAEQARTIGVDNFEVFKANTSLMDIRDEAEKFKQQPSLYKTLPTRCSSLWSSIYVGPDGTLFPCSLSFRASESFGNLLHSDLRDIWNNSQYLSARQLFSSKKPIAEKIPSPCNQCKYFFRCFSNAPN